MQAQLVSGYNDLLPRFSSLLELAGRRSFFASRAWFDALSETTLGPSERLFIVGLEDGSAHETLPAAAMMCRVGASSGLRRGGLPARLSSLTGPYTTLFSLALDPENALRGDAARRLARAVGGARPRPAIQELECLEHESPEFAGLLEGYRSAGLVVVPYRHFANWYEPIEASFDHYLAQRPSVLRNTLRRKSKRLNELGQVELALTRGGDELERAIADYESIYAASWKQPEPAEGFAAGLVRAAAPAGALRLGILRLDGRPIAAQIWIVSGGTATIFKLAHVEAAKELSPGSILLAFMARQAIEADRVREIDFGRGDDPYKRMWLGHCRERWGMMVLDPYQPQGLAQVLRHGLPARVRAVLRRVRGSVARP